jgi:hypothetical protein
MDSAASERGPLAEKSNEFQFFLKDWVFKYNYRTDVPAYNTTHYHFKYTYCTDALTYSTIHLRNRPTIALWNNQTFVADKRTDLYWGYHELKYQATSQLACPRFVMDSPSP